MWRALRSLLLPKPPAAVTATYITLVGAARNPFFYTQLSVPDTIDGRFDLIVLHLFLLQHRLLAATAAETPAAHAFAQRLSEAFFTDMDRSLRELGVADTGVSKRIKKMGKAYHGRLQAYAAALSEPTHLRAALVRNLYGTLADGDVKALDRLAHYVEKTSQHLANSELATLMAGNYAWPDVATV